VFRSIVIPLSLKNERWFRAAARRRRASACPFSERGHRGRRNSLSSGVVSVAALGTTAINKQLPCRGEGRGVIWHPCCFYLSVPRGPFESSRPFRCRKSSIGPRRGCFASQIGQNATHAGGPQGPRGERGGAGARNPAADPVRLRARNSHPALFLRTAEYDLVLLNYGNGYAPSGPGEPGFRGS
jgi:hypothetical protein